MAIIISCPDCGRGYELADVLRERDSNGSRPMQCPHCHTLIGRTAHDATDGDLSAPSRPPTPPQP